MLDGFDRRIHYLRISVTDKCNLRCAYCMPPEGISMVRHEDVLSFEEIHAFTVKAVGMGIDKVRLTGGEPLVRRDILKLVGMLAGIQGIKDYAMTTNGVLLDEFAVPLRKAGLHRVNISLDSVDPGRFKEITRVGELDRVLTGIDVAMAAGFRKVKLNCVVEKSADEPDAIGVRKFAEGKGLEVRFIRRMDLHTGHFWPVNGGDGGHCEKCNRLRLSSDGKLYPCLFNDIFFSVRELGPEKALALAIGNKPRAGTRSDRGIHVVGG